METVEANGRITSDNGDLALEVNLEEIVVTAYRWSLYDQLFKKWQEWLNNFHLPQSNIMSILKTALTPSLLFVNPRINDPNALEGGYSWTYDEHNVPIRIRNKSEIHPEDLEAYLERQKYYEDSAQQALAKGQPFVIGAMGRISRRGGLGQRSSKAAEEIGGVEKEGSSFGKTPWGSWADYEKVTVNIEGGTQTYAKVGDRLYSRHAVDRMQPSGNRFGHPITQAGGDYGRSISPEYVEEVLRTTQPILQENGNLSYVLGSVEVITNKMGAVITIITK